jgi:hypothetical protein
MGNVTFVADCNNPPYQFFEMEHRTMNPSFRLFRRSVTFNGKHQKSRLFLSAFFETQKPRHFRERSGQKRTPKSGQNSETLSFGPSKKGLGGPNESIASWFAGSKSRLSAIA